MGHKKAKPKQFTEQDDVRRTKLAFTCIIGFFLAGVVAEVAEKIQHYIWMKERGVGFFELAPWDLHWEYFTTTGIYLDLVTLGCWFLAWMSVRLLSTGD